MNWNVLLRIVIVFPSMRWLEMPPSGPRPAAKMKLSSISRLQFAAAPAVITSRMRTFIALPQH